MNNSSLTVSPTSLSFGDEATGSTTAAQSVTVSNPGSTAATISSIATSGQYTQTNTSGSSLAATAWATRTQTLSVLGSPNGRTWTTLAASANYTFNPATGFTRSWWARGTRGSAPPHRLGPGRHA